MLPDEFRQFLHAQEGLFDFLVPLALRRGVESGDDFEALFFEAPIGEEGEAEVADADEDDGLEPGGSELVGDFPGELADIVAQAAGAEGAEVGEVLPELGGLDAGGLGERLAGDGADEVLAQPGEAAHIDG